MLKFKQLRLNAGFTQQEIADKLGITRGAYTNIENGKREADYKTLEFLSSLYSVTTDELLGLSYETKEPTILNDDELGVLSPEEQELAEIVEKLNDAQLQELLDFARWKLRGKSAD